jgi:hypothetical protein
LSYTQRMIFNNTLNSFLGFAILYPLIIFACTYNYSRENLLKLSLINSIFLIYYFLLLLLKKKYRKLNDWFISKRRVNKMYANKDFTFVHWDGDGAIPDYWDEKRAISPSWLDKLITFLLLILPLLFIGILVKLFAAFLL